MSPLKQVITLLNLCAAPSVLTESHHALPNSFHLVVTQFLAKFDTVALLQSLHHFLCNEKQMRALRTTSLKRCVSMTDAIDRWEKIHA